MRSDADRTGAPETAIGAGASSMLHGVFAMSLTCMAGYLDAVGYTHLAGLYVSFMSGNSTRLGIAIAEGDRALLVPCAVVIVGFLTGAFIGSWIGDAVSRFKLTAVLATEIALLLLTIALSLGTAGYAAQLPICVAMGIQNAAHETIAGADLGKSFITGFLFNLGKALAHLAQDRAGAAQALAYGASWSAFLLGVVLGSAALSHFGLTGSMSVAAGVLVALAIGAASDQLDSPNLIADSRRRSTSP
jgi:oxalate decarboxylase